jgi:arylsulfatase A-like enzyme
LKNTRHLRYVHPSSLPGVTPCPRSGKAVKPAYLDRRKKTACMIRQPVAYRILLCFTLLALAGCNQDAPSLRARFRHYNLLLISIDTLRADYVGAYGKKNKTPVIDSLAGRGFLFESMFTTSSTTLPAHLSLMTSLYPRDCRNGYAVQESVTTLAEVLARNGYTCLAAVSALPLDPRFNIQQGFSFYDADFSSCRGSVNLKDRKWFDHGYGVFDCNAEETTRRAIAALETQKPEAPFFMWVHYYDPHLPYGPPAGFYDPGKVARTDFPYFLKPGQSDRESLQELYSGEIRFVDAQVEKLLEGVGRLYDPQRTIIVLVADHGENLYEHDGYLDHSRVVYDTVMWIPCIMCLPGFPGKRIAELASSIDVMPTLLDLLGIETKGCEGISLAGLMEAAGPAPVRSYVTCETNDFGVKDEDQAIAVRTLNSKYIYNNWKSGKDLFLNLQILPRERRPVAEDAIKKELTGYYHEWRKQYKSGNLALQQQLDTKTEDALKSLGYLQ